MRKEGVGFYFAIRLAPRVSKNLRFFRKKYILIKGRGRNMFKGTNKVWKGIALALCLCMLPTVALATDANTVDVYYDNTVTDNVKITVDIGDSTGIKPETEVTILALRKATDAVYSEEDSAFENPQAAGTIFEEGTTAEDMQKQIIYIDQKTSDENGTVEFVFAPTSMDAAYSSKYIDVYVGGADVDAVQHFVVKRTMPAPAGVTVEGTWYKGAELILNVTAGGLTDAQVANWAGGTTAEFTVTEGEVEDLEIGAYFADGKIAIPASHVTGKTITKIAFVNGGYDTVEFTHAGLAEALKPAGTLGAVTTTVTADDVTAEIACAGNAEWIGDIDFNAVTVDGVPVATEDFSITEGTITVVMPAIGTEVLEKSYVIEVSVDGYTSVSKTVTVTAPTKDAMDALVRPVPTVWANEFYTEATGYDAADPDAVAKWGKQKIALPATADGQPVAWTATAAVGEADAEEYTLTAADEGFYYLPRTEGGVTTYVLTATIEVEGFKEATKTFTVTANQLGVAGVDVSITLTGGIANGATLMLMDAETGLSAIAELVAQNDFVFDNRVTNAEKNTVVFMSSTKVPAGDYKLVITRPGFVTKKVDVTVTTEAVVVLPTMAAKTDFVFGDNVGSRGGASEPDGVVFTPDYNGLCATFRISEAYQLKYDFNGDGVVDTADYNALCAVFGYGR